MPAQTCCSVSTYLGDATVVARHVVFICQLNGFMDMLSALLVVNSTGML